jgi:uncharacterized protein YoxC
MPERGEPPDGAGLQWRVRDLERRLAELERRTESVNVMQSNIDSIWKAIDRLSHSVDNLRTDMRAGIKELQQEIAVDVNKITEQQASNSRTLIAFAFSVAGSAILVAATVYLVFT